MSEAAQHLPVLLAAYGSSSRTGWEERHCCVCGDLTPSWGAPAICDPCEVESVKETYQRVQGVRVVTDGPLRVSQAVDAAQLVVTSDLPDLPGHNLDPDLDAYVDGRLERKDGTEPALGLLIYGETGSGKSCQAMQLGLEWITRRRRTVLYRTEGELLENLRAFEGGENQRERHRLRGVDLLIIDDLGTQKQSDWTYGQFYELFDYRYRNNKHTVITTNHWLSEQQVAAAKARGQQDAQLVRELPHIDARIWRRIQSLCRSVLMERRQPKGAA